MDAAMVQAIEYGIYCTSPKRKINESAHCPTEKGHRDDLQFILSNQRLWKDDGCHW
jgi:hypothetical protein